MNAASELQDLEVEAGVLREQPPKYHRQIKKGPNKGRWVITEKFRISNLNNFSWGRAEACRHEAEKLETVTWSQEVLDSEK